MFPHVVCPRGLGDESARRAEVRLERMMRDHAERLAAEQCWLARSPYMDAATLLTRTFKRWDVANTGCIDLQVNPVQVQAFRANDVVAASSHFLLGC